MPHVGIEIDPEWVLRGTRDRSPLADQGIAFKSSSGVGALEKLIEYCHGWTCLVGY
ncbi:MAG: hypothetical protein ACKN9W_13845 [Methylococcus sp.]